LETWLRDRKLLSPPKTVLPPEVARRLHTIELFYGLATGTPSQRVVDSMDRLLTRLREEVRALSGPASASGDAASPTRYRAKGRPADQIAPAPAIATDETDRQPIQVQPPVRRPEASPSATRPAEPEVEGGSSASAQSQPTYPVAVASADEQPAPPPAGITGTADVPSTELPGDSHEARGAPEIETAPSAHRPADPVTAENIIATGHTAMSDSPPREPGAEAARTSGQVPTGQVPTEAALQSSGNAEQPAAADPQVGEVRSRELPGGTRPGRARPQRTIAYNHSASGRGWGPVGVARPTSAGLALMNLEPAVGRASSSSATRDSAANLRRHLGVSAGRPGNEAERRDTRSPTPPGPIPRDGQSTSTAGLGTSDGHGGQPSGHDGGSNGADPPPERPPSPRPVQWPGSSYPGTGTGQVMDREHGSRPAGLP
jgi:translation initiation factor IF-2